MEKIKAGKLSINLISYILGPYWLLLKGMIFYGISMMLAMFGFLFLFRNSNLKLFGYAFNIVLFLWGNKLYYNFVNDKVEKIMQLHSDQDLRIKAVQDQKKRSYTIGLSVSIVLIAALIWIFFIK